MNRFMRYFLVPIGIMLPSLLAGCCHDGCGIGDGKLLHGPRRHGYWPHIDNCADIPPGAFPAPNGAFVRNHRTIMTTKADADDYVIYLYEWVGRSTELGPFGRRHIEKIAWHLPDVHFPVVIEPLEDDPQLTEERRMKIVELLSLRGIPDAGARVIPGYPRAEGLNGDEAERVYEEMLTRQSNLLGNLFGGYGFGGYGGLGGFGGFFGGGLPFGGFGGFRGTGGFFR